MNEPLALVITLTIFDIEIGIRSGSRRLLHRVRQLRDSRKVSPYQDGLCPKGLELWKGQGCPLVWQDADQGSRGVQEIAIHQASVLVPGNVIGRRRLTSFRIAINGMVGCGPVVLHEKRSYFSKMGQLRGLLLFIFGLFKQTSLQFLQQI